MIFRHAPAIHQARGAAIAGFGDDAHFNVLNLNLALSLDRKTSCETD
jgi:hypothetical protein